MTRRLAGLEETLRKHYHDYAKLVVIAYEKNLWVLLISLVEKIFINWTSTSKMWIKSQVVAFSRECTVNWLFLCFVVAIDYILINSTPFSRSGNELVQKPSLSTNWQRLNWLNKYNLVETEAWSTVKIGNFRCKWTHCSNPAVNTSWSVLTKSKFT